LKTSNGGVNWIVQSNGTSTVFFSVYFVSNQTGWVVGSSGNIYKTTTGGDPLVGIEEIRNSMPSAFALYQNYPNPFNPSTKIKFDIAPLLDQGGVSRAPRDGVVTLKIYDILGCEITTLVNRQMQPGTYEVEWSAVNYPSGVYFYRLTAGDFSQSKKLVLLK
jgi:hypothetical protein